MRIIGRAATLALALGIAAPALAQSQSISASDKAQGAEANPQLTAEYGGAYSGSQAPFVVRVGQRVAVQSGLSNAQSDFTVTLLNSPVENAFAIPGGYVYVTRQLLALMNSEAELGFVLGHEVGHVAARHSNKRNTRSTIYSVGAALAGLLTKSDLVGRIAGTGAQLGTLSYGRSQEYEADSLGVRYVAASGYNPIAAPRILDALNADVALQGRIAGRQTSVPTWFSTHPNGADRVARARQLAQASGKAQGAGTQDIVFLKMLDGMRYDDDPAQGIVDGQTFRHPGLKLRFTAPAGYALANGADAVTIAGARGRAQFKMGAATADLAAFIADRFKELGATIDPATVRVTGKSASASVAASANNQPVDATIAALAWPGATYYFVVVTPQGSGIGPFQPLIDSLAPLTDAEAAAITGKRLRVIAVKKGDTIDALARRMAYPAFQKERFLTLNGLAEGTALKPGTLVKIVVTG